jgi:hypothetical protein
MVRSLAVGLAFAMVASTAAAASQARAAEVPAYTRANERLARATPHYRGARLLTEETIGGEVGRAPFEAVQRVDFLARPQTQRTVIGFYRRKLGAGWRLRGSRCLVSRSRLVVAMVYPKSRRFGLLLDSRSASRCGALAALVSDLLRVGHRDG